jgi:N-acetylneuraminate synthase
MLERIVESNKPIFLATGASNMNDVKRAMNILNKSKQSICLMQCNTNYTAELENFKYINLNVLKTFSEYWPEVILGLSDHTPGHATVLGAVSLGARAIEKHFTDDKARNGPDHLFSMDPNEWHEMVSKTRELEVSLGSRVKVVEANEKETVLLQRRCLRASRDLEIGSKLSSSDFDVLRPSMPNGIMPYESSKIFGCKLNRPLKRGEHITLSDVG